MNDKQIIVLIGVVIIMLAMLLFPPFDIRASSGSINFGYAFIFSPPHPSALVNPSLLFFQWVVLTSIGFIAWPLFK